MVHLVVDSGELGQPDDAFCLEGMAGRRTCDDTHVGCAVTQRLLPTWDCNISCDGSIFDSANTGYTLSTNSAIPTFGKTMHDSASPT